MTRVKIKQERWKFLTEKTLLYLYAPEKIIKLIEQFIDMVREGNKASDDDKKRKINEIIKTMRKDLGLAETKINVNFSADVPLAKKKIR